MPRQPCATRPRPRDLSGPANPELEVFDLRYIVELNPALDHRNMTAELAVDLVESLFGKSTLMRMHRHCR